MLLLSHIKDEKTKAQKKVTTQGYTICNLKGRDSNLGHLTPGIRLLTTAAFHCREPMYQSMKHKSSKKVCSLARAILRPLLFWEGISPPGRMTAMQGAFLGDRIIPGDLLAPVVGQHAFLPGPHPQLLYMPGQFSPSTYTVSTGQCYNSQEAEKRPSQDHEIGHALWVPQCESKI